MCPFTPPPHPDAGVRDHTWRSKAVTFPRFWILLIAYLRCLLSIFPVYLLYVHYTGTYRYRGLIRFKVDILNRSEVIN